MTKRPILFLKSALLAFWALWFTVVLATNVADGAKVLGLLDESWTFASGNYRFICETTARYDTPVWLNGLLFTGVIAWEAAAAVLFWLAWWSRRWVYPAFTIGLMLWAAFLIADEVFIAYAVAATHIRLFTAQLVTLMAIELLPEDRASRLHCPSNS